MLKTRSSRAKAKKRHEAEVLELNALKDELLAHSPDHLECACAVCMIEAMTEMITKTAYPHSALNLIVNTLQAGVDLRCGGRIN
jgi:hypothetical protein